MSYSKHSFNYLPDGPTNKLSAIKMRRWIDKSKPKQMLIGHPKSGYFMVPKKWYEETYFHHLRNKEVHIGHHTVVVKKRRTIYRYSFSDIGNSQIKNNYKWLGTNLLNSPSPKGIKLDKFNTSAESRIRKFNSKPASDYSKFDTEKVVTTLAKSYVNQYKISQDDLLNESLWHLNPEYRRGVGNLKKIVKKKFPENIKLTCTDTHGDLTDKNILWNNTEQAFIDGDRSTIAPPEFDLLFLNAVIKTHANHEIIDTNKHYLEAIVDFSKNAKIELKQFYKLRSEFLDNSKHISLITHLLICRFTTLAVSNLSDKKDIEAGKRELSYAKAILEKL